MTNDTPKSFALSHSTLLRVWLSATLIAGFVTCVLLLSGLLPTDTAISRFMAVGLAAVLPFWARDIWRFNAHPAVLVTADTVQVHSHGRTRRFDRTQLRSVAVRRERFKDYLTLELDHGQTHCLAVQFRDDEHRRQIEAWLQPMVPPHAGVD